MPRIEFTAEIERQDGRTVIHLIGDIDRGARESLDAAYAGADGPGALVLDFTRAGYINSTGIALIVGILAKARATRRPVRAFGLSDHYREIFEITRISDFISIYDDAESALHTL
jgi:anti-anti-sigma factor